MLVSTFELLVKPQFPQRTVPELPPEALEKLTPLTRTIVQGYFLTIANIINEQINLVLEFTAITPGLDTDIVVTALETSGQDVLGTLTPGTSENKLRSKTISLAPNDTGLFILLPNIAKNNGELLEQSNFEVRGYVEILLSPETTSNSAKLLLTPEHRGTFFGSLEQANPKLGEVAYALPTANGQALFELTVDLPV